MKDSQLEDTFIVKGDKFSLKQCSISYLGKRKRWKIYSSCFTYGESYVCLSLFSSQHSILVGVLGRYVSNHGMLH